MSVDMLPCPFCGESVDRSDIDEAETEVQVVCPHCLAGGPIATLGCRDDEEEEIDLLDEAVEYWNRRPEKRS